MNKLQTILIEKSQSKFEKFNLIKTQAKDILPKIRVIFSEYNNHDIKHAETVVEILDDIIPDDIKNSFNSDEIFCLLSAAWLHDIGMVPDKDEIKEFEDSDKEQREEIRTDIREKHHIRSYNFVLNHDFFNLDEDEKKIIANICRAHRQINIKDSLDETYRISSSRSNIRLQFLGAILRVADECDITSKRVSKHYIEESRSDIGFSLHDKKHELIDDLYLQSDKIIIRALVKSQDDLNIVNRSKRKIEEEIEGVKDILEYNNLILNSVDVKFDQDTWIERKITLVLSDCKENTIDMINQEIDNDRVDIVRNLENLEARKIIKRFNQEEGEDPKFALSEDFFTFTRILDMNYGFDSLKDYIYSPLSLKIIEKELMPYLMDLYNFILTDTDEIKSRIEILKKSPTAIYLGLNGKEIFSPNLNISLMQGKYLFDLLLLLGFYYDTYRYQMTIENIDDFLNKYIKPLCAEICTNLPEYIEFFNEAQASARNNQSEKISDLVSEETPGKHKFTMKVTSNEGEPDILDMINASRKTGQSFEITGDRLSGFNTDFEIGSGKITALKIMPEDPIIHLNLNVPESDICFNDLQFARIIDNGNIKLSTEKRNLPYKFDMIPSGEFNEENLMQGGQFSFKLIPEDVDVSNLLKWEKFLHRIHSNKKIILKDHETEKIIVEAELDVDEEILGSQKWFDLLDKLVFIQNETGCRIKVPNDLNIPDKDVQNTNIIHDFLILKEMTIPIDNVKISLKIDDIKQILVSKDEKGLFRHMNVIYPDYAMNVLENKIDLGPVNIHLDNFKIINEKEIDAENKDNDESFELIIEPEDEFVSIKTVEDNFTIKD